MKDKNLCYESTAMEMLGLSRLAFRKLGLEPVSTVTNPHNRKGPPSRLFDKTVIESLKSSIALPEPRKAFDYATGFIKKYGSPDDSILDAAQAMFNLNRYCKHGSCSSKNQAEIYGLKNKLIEKLYRSGYSTDVNIHQLVIPEKQCYRCEDEEDNFCEHCHGTGIYRKATTFRFYVFRFVIQDKVFVWHQPDKSVNFKIKVDASRTPSAINETEVKPLEIPQRKLTEAKALVRWYIS